VSLLKPCLKLKSNKELVFNGIRSCRAGIETFWLQSIKVLCIFLREQLNVVVLHSSHLTTVNMYLSDFLQKKRYRMKILSCIYLLSFDNKIYLVLNPLAQVNSLKAIKHK